MPTLSSAQLSINSFVQQRNPFVPRFGLVGRYPPARCGMSTVTANLATGLEANGANVCVIRLADDQASTDPRVVGELVSGAPRSVAACAELLSQCQVVVVQHGFEVHDEPHGDEVVALLREVSVPTIAVVRDVPRHPSGGQRTTLEALVAAADEVVVFSDVARQRLCTSFAVDGRKVSTIPRGASIPRSESAKRGGRPMLLTWGLLRPEKGIERVIDAMGSLHSLRGQPRYVFSGPTHPAVLAAHGDDYREARREQARSAGLAGSVSLDPTYHHPRALAALVQSSAVVVLPYHSTDQVASGVLVDAVTSGRPVVATAFPHAVELLGSGAGVVVGHDDPDAMVLAVRQILSDPRTAGTMAAEGRRLAPGLGWSSVARSYVAMAQRMIRDQRAGA